MAGANGLTIAASGAVHDTFTDFAGSGILIKGSNVTVTDCNLGITSAGVAAEMELDSITIAAGSTGRSHRCGERATLSGNHRYGIGILGANQLHSERFDRHGLD